MQIACREQIKSIFPLLDKQYRRLLSARTLTFYCISSTSSAKKKLYFIDFSFKKTSYVSYQINFK